MHDLSVLHTTGVTVEVKFDPLEPFVHDQSVLHTTGVTDEVKFDLSYTFKGALLAFLADNLASHLLGGFKLSFSFTFRSCHTCMLPTSDFSKHVVDDECVLRNTQSHLQQCKLIEGSAGDHYSKIYGLNYRTCLLDIPSFSLFDGELPHDLIHDVFEGVLPVEAKLLLSSCISQGYFTFDYYSKQLLAFP